jgi:hypothetical protein
MSIIIWILLALLSLKVIWNFCVPYMLLQSSIDPKTGKSRGISLSLGIEASLLIFSLILSWFSNGNSFVNQPLFVLAYGGGAILASYMHFFVAGMIGGWFVTRSRKK